MQELFDFIIANWPGFILITIIAVAVYILNDNTYGRGRNKRHR